MKSSSAVTALLVLSATLLAACGQGGAYPTVASMSVADTAAATASATGGQSAGAAAAPAAPPSATPSASAVAALSGTAAASATGAASLSISSSATTITFAVTYQGTPTFLHVAIDSDQNASTGYAIGGIGADYLIENGFFYRYSGLAGAWGWTLITTVPLSESSGVATWTIARSDLGSAAAITAVGNYGSVNSAPVSYTLQAPAAGGSGGGTGGSAATTRDPLKWPFAATSIWNMPIGAGATYVPSGLHFTTTPNSTEYWYDMPQSDHERIVLTPSAPLTDVYISNVGWSGGNRCVQQGALFFQAPIPAAYVVPNSTYNNGAAILLADGLTLVQTQPFTRCSGYAYATTMQVPYSLALWEYNLQTGDGRLGAHGGSNLSTLGGTIRMGELRPGTQMLHALKVNVDSVTSLGLCTGKFSACFTWPAATADGYAANAGSGYGSATNNTNSAMKMGALLAIPASVNIGTIGLQSVPGKMLAWTLQNYGAYIVDSRGSPGFDFSIEDGAAGSKATEFQTDYGFPFDGRLGYLTLKDSTGQPTPQAKWVSDIRLIIDFLRVVSNNSPTRIGGGGTPLQPLAPVFK